MRTTHATSSDPMPQAFPRAATVRISALATAFLTGTAAISLLVAPAAGAATLPAAPVQATVSSSVSAQALPTTWGHDDKHKFDWSKWKKGHKPPHHQPPAQSTETITIAWLMPHSKTAKVSWPQEYVGTVPDCGTGWYQVDVYRYGTEAEKKHVEWMISDGILTGPAEDGKVYLSHKFVQPTNDPAICAPKPPVVTPPVVTPPVVTPPVVTPPVVTPPVVTPPVVTPPVVTPPVVTPPVVTPPVDDEDDEQTVVVPPTTPISGVGGTYEEAPAPKVVPPATGTKTVAPPVAVATPEGQLAVTGAKVGFLSALAAALVAAGAFAFRYSRRAQAAQQ